MNSRISSSSSSTKIPAREQFYDGTWRFLNYQKHLLRNGLDAVESGSKITTITHSMFYPGTADNVSIGARWGTFARQNGAWEGQRGVVADFATVIKKGAFYGANYLSQMYCPELVTIEDEGFYDCDYISFSRFYMPKLEYIGSRAFFSAAHTDLWKDSEYNMCIVNFPKVRYMGFQSFFVTLYITEFHIGNNHVITTTTADKTAIRNFVLDDIPANYTNNIRDLDASNKDANDSCYLYKTRFASMVNAKRISVCDMGCNLPGDWAGWGTNTKVLDFPTMQFFMDHCLYNHRNTTSINIKNALLIDNAAFMYLGYDVSTPMYIDIPECLFAGYDAFEDAMISGVKADNLVRLGYSAFEMQSSGRGRDNLKHFYAPKLKVIDAFAFRYCHALVDSKYSTDGGKTWTGSGDLEFPEVTTVRQQGLYDTQSVKTLRLPKCTTFGDHALSISKSGVTGVKIYLDAFTADSLVWDQMDNRSVDDRGIYYAINVNKDNIRVYCEKDTSGNYHVLRWVSSLARWCICLNASDKKTYSHSDSDWVKHWNNSGPAEVWHWDGTKWSKYGNVAT